MSTDNGQHGNAPSYELPWPKELSQGLLPGLLWAATSFVMFMVSWLYGLASIILMFIFFQTQRNTAVGKARRHYVQGRLAYRRNEIHEALGHFNKALEIKPEAAAIYPVVGDIYFYLGDLPKAKKAYLSYFQRNDQDHQMRVWYAGKFMELGLFADAVREFKRLPADVKKELQVANLFAVSLLKTKQAREAIQLLEPVVHKHSDVKEEQALSARYFLGRAYLDAGEKEKSRRILQKLEQDQPGYEDVADILKSL